MRDVVITGIGLISSLGEGHEAHRIALNAGSAPNVDEATFAPYPVHPMVALNLDKHIPKKSDQRQMEPWQRYGVYAAGLALESAGVTDPELKAAMQVIVAAGGGERDYAVDGQILTGIKTAADKGAFLNERLMGDLRPTLFLAQLSNLLAGNIAIVHGITGASRTFMGEEQAGMDALRIARSRIAHGQADIMLVGGSYNAERPDVLLIYAMGGLLRKVSFASVWDREKQSGFIPGSAGAFLVLEAADHAKNRGAKAFAKLDTVVTDQPARAAGSVEASLISLFEQSGGSADLIVSGATGCSGITHEERAALGRLPDITTGNLIGHGIEAQAPFGVALAALALNAGQGTSALVTSVGHQRGEGVARVSRGSA